jgi:phage/plasmid primase-like uncharacterized protein
MTARREWIGQARAASLERELERRGILTKLAKHGAERVGPCPRCGGTDRFAVCLKKKVWNCRGCRRGGGVVELVMLLDGCTFVDAVATLTGQVRERRDGARDPKRDTKTNQQSHRNDREPTDAERTERALERGRPARTFSAQVLRLARHHRAAAGRARRAAFSSAVPVRS